MTITEQLERSYLKGDMGRLLEELTYCITNARDAVEADAKKAAIARLDQAEAAIAAYRRNH
jgi:hypothetical protein